MELLIRIMGLLRRFFSDRQTLERSRTKNKYFTKKRKLTFYICLAIGLAHCTGSLAYGLLEFFSEQTGTSELATASAYSQQREHFTELPYKEAFWKVRDLVLEDYTENETFKRRDGKIFVAVDGSLVALPDKKELLEKFGGIGPKKDSPTARMTILYDPLNEIIYEAAFDPLKVGERRQATRLIKRLGGYMDLKDVVFIFDRGYISKNFVKKLDKLGANYIMRVKRKFSTDFDRLGEGDHTVYFHGKKKRLLKFRLDSPVEGAKKGEVETIFTNLWGPDESEFKELYFLRWPVEVEYDTIKNKIELPNFNGYLPNSIMQDFWISMLIANIVSVVAAVADGELEERKKVHKETKYEYKASISEIVNGMRIELPRILMAETEKEVRDRLRCLLGFALENTEPVRPGRSFIRSLARNVKYHYNRKHH